jgi:hypothetical protein
MSLDPGYSIADGRSCLVIVVRPLTMMRVMIVVVAAGRESFLLLFLLLLLLLLFARGGVSSVGLILYHCGIVQRWAY